jgi:LacI family transcriptional regulator
MTILDVAKRAKVSSKTASRVFNNNPSVRSYIRQRVLDAAKELNYSPNLLAKGLRTNRIDMISLMIKDLDNNFYGLLMEKLSSKIAENFFEPIICENIHRVKRLNETLSPAGSIMLYPYNEKETLILAESQKIVTVMLDKNFRDIPNVTVDFYSAYSTLLKEAIKQGRKKFVYYYYQDLCEIDNN